MERLRSIDMLRGLVIVLMALDHVRDFWHNSTIVPTDLFNTTPVLFATRWLSHFCAPVFFLLAGMSIYLYLQKAGTKATSQYLIRRGLMLIVLELVLFSRIWTGGNNTFLLQVIWTLGVSMMVMAAGIYLKPNYLLGLSLLLILGHNALDAFDSLAYTTQVPGLSTLWSLLHVGATRFSLNLGFFKHQVYIVYPLIPWIGVMGLGFCMGPLMKLSSKERLRWLVGLGSAMILGFISLRLSNVYGDPVPWVFYNNPEQTLMSFLNCEKYPPSLLYLMMTLGPSLLGLAAFETIKPVAPLLLFGRTALFFYVLHLPLIVCLRSLVNFTMPEFDGLNLLGTYIVWGLILLLIYPLCYAYDWFRSKKRT